MLLCLVFALTPLTSCEWDTSKDFDHPLYVTYTISAGVIEFNGPEQLLVDIQTWIKANQLVYDKEVNYTTGEASEFEKTDEAAVKKYAEFAPKFKAYIENDVTKSLKDGKYDDHETNTKATVTAMFYTSAARTQGENGHLKYDQIKFTYP